MPSKIYNLEYTTIQSLIWPELGICTERDLYFRLSRPAGYSYDTGTVQLAPGGGFKTNTWFNLFNIGKWKRHCDLSSLYLTLTGSGECEISVILAHANQSWERMTNEIVTLSKDTPLKIDLGHCLEENYDEGVLFFEVHSLSGGELLSADWQTRDRPRRVPELALSITTFKREAAVARTTQRFQDYIAHSPHRDHISMIVVDNGQSVDIAETPHLTVVPNANLGGAGGFARGQIAARDTGATHCLFMDDDASIHMASLDRTYQFLAYACDCATAVAGAMLNDRRRWAVWENGAVFHTRCYALHMGTDLREVKESFDMEFETTGEPPENHYGGWWYFAFPLAGAWHMPFPFFVRGDDVSFSLANDFNIVTLNGVASFQESFTDKESPLTWYLDLRSHMAHHLSLPTMEIGRFATLKIAIMFLLRTLPRMHYETVAAINLALEDVMKGPDFFDAHADMAERRGDLGALTKDEAWKPIEGRRPQAGKRRFNPRNRWTRLFMMATLNGHLLPFFSRFADRIVLTSRERGILSLPLAACEVTYLSADRRKYYTVRHSKTKCLRSMARFARNALVFLLRYNHLKTRYHEGYREMTTETYWRRKLGLSEAGAKDKAA